MAKNPFKEAEDADRKAQEALSAHMAAGEPADVDAAVQHHIKTQVLQRRHRDARERFMAADEERQKAEAEAEANARSAKLALARVIASAQAFTAGAGAAHLRQSIQNAKDAGADAKTAKVLDDFLAALESVQKLAAA